MIYVFAALTALVAGLIMSAASGTVDFRTVTNGSLLFDVILVVVLGGIPLRGGRGGVRNIIVGVALIAVLRNGMTLMDFTTQTQDMLKGLVLLTAIVTDNYLNPRDTETDTRRRSLTMTMPINEGGSMHYELGRYVKAASAAALAGAMRGSRPATGAQADSNIAGKKVIFVPIAMGISLTEGWARRMREHAAIGGYTIDVRDAAFNTGVMSELLAKAISEKPDVLVVHNPTVQLLSRQIKQAEAEGIKVLQINLQSNQPSAAFVGANWDRIGREIAEDIVKECGEGQRQVRQGRDHSRPADRCRQRDHERGGVQGVRGTPGDRGRLEPGLGLGARRRPARSPRPCCSSILTCAPSSATGTSTPWAPAMP